MKKIWKIAGINFDHFHMGDLLRYAHEHPHAEIVGISDVAALIAIFGVMAVLLLEFGSFATAGFS